MVTIDLVIARGVLARELREPQHRAEQILNTRQHIRPLHRVGIVRAHVPDAAALGYRSESTAGRQDTSPEEKP